jgi:hypothetical protein
MKYNEQQVPFVVLPHNKNLNTNKKNALRKKWLRNAVSY